MARSDKVLAELRAALERHPKGHVLRAQIEEIERLEQQVQEKAQEVRRLEREKLVARAYNEHLRQKETDVRAETEAAFAEIVETFDSMRSERPGVIFLYLSNMSRRSTTPDGGRSEERLRAQLEGLFADAIVNLLQRIKTNTETDDPLTLTMAFLEAARAMGHEPDERVAVALSELLGRAASVD